MIETKKDYLMKLKEIEGFIDAGKTVPFGTLVNTKAMNAHIEELKGIVSSQIKDAQAILSREAEIIQEAEEEARQIVERTKYEIMNQDIAHQAEDYARNLVAKAQEEAKDKIKNASDLRTKMLISSHKYLENLFDEMEQQLIETKNLIADNRDEIRDSLQKKIEMMDKLTS